MPKSSTANGSCLQRRPRIREKVGGLGCLVGDEAQRVKKRGPDDYAQARKEHSDRCHHPDRRAESVPRLSIE